MCVSGTVRVCARCRVSACQMMCLCERVFVWMVLDARV